MITNQNAVKNNEGKTQIRIQLEVEQLQNLLTLDFLNHDVLFYEHEDIACQGLFV